MADYEVKQSCEICDTAGTVIQTGSDGISEEIECNNCNGTGYEWVGTLYDLRADIDDIKDKLNDIWEKLSE